MSSYVCDHSSCRRGLQRHISFSEIGLRCSALIVLLSSITWEMDLAVKINSLKDNVWFGYVASLAGAFSSQPFQPFFPTLSPWMLFGVAESLSLSLSISKVARCSDQFSQERLMLLGWRNRWGAESPVLSLFLAVSLTPSWHSKAVPDLHSGCPPNCLIWENGAIGPILLLLNNWRFRQGCMEQWDWNLHCHSVCLHSTHFMVYHIDCAIQNPISLCMMGNIHIYWTNWPFPSLKPSAIVTYK